MQSNHCCGSTVRAGASHLRESGAGVACAARLKGEFSDLITEGPWVDVRAHGADGTDTQDDSAAVQAAIDAVEARVGKGKFGDGGVVYLPRGKYYVTGLRISKFGVTLRGDGILQARPITALPPAESPGPLTWPKPPRGVMYGRTSFAELIPNPVSPLFATFGLRMADIPTQELMKRIARAKINYSYVPVNGYVFMVAGLSFPELVAYTRMSVRITRMVLQAQEHCQAARQEFVREIQAWEAKDIVALSPSELLSGAGIIFQAAVRLYTHIQAGTVPLSTISEACFTQWFAE